MNRVYIYWWNFKKAAKKVYVWLGVFFILAAGSAAALRDLDPPSIVGAAVTVLLVVGLIWRLRASFKGDWWDDEGDIRDERNERSEGSWGTGNPGDLDGFFWDDDW
jgi:protein-S-isoprenylcysteine O-methyltransferase Ste14